MIRSRDARRRATQVLEMAGMTDPPVDVWKVAQFLGFEVIPFEFPETISGMTFIEEGVKSIGVNYYHHMTRQRFSIAHEIGHYLLGHEAYDDSNVHVNDRPSYLNAYNRQEGEANEFAAELLMPAASLRRDVAEYGLNVPKLAKRYQVSEQAMWIQLLDLNLTGVSALRSP